MTRDTTTHETTTHDRTRRRLAAVAICIYCGNDMIHGTSCIDAPLRIGGVDFPPIRWGEERGYRFTEMTERCGDCGVPRGAVHHHGCDLEQCPACEAQLLSCGCTDDPDHKDDHNEDAHKEDDHKEDDMD